MKREELMQILPHRDGMLLVDEAVVEDGVSKGSYHIRGDEWFLQGHFPGNPVVPGVILCEMMAQSACVLLSQEDVGATPYFTSLNNVKFRRPVRPGDTLQSECRILKTRHTFVFAEGKGYVDGKLCVSAEFSFAVVKE
ncbi:3-hydroxyacyl-ACP dehydratase FabZ [Yeguia hominis]|uniref:3-hydroxyacyl-ACP dehydratase FabZ n=1 Tax=Yeguia hominis TaxID=2763662 RepID=A0A926DBJ0_9FIRM|nr:3-hydroxyacyl-ACP dehydratase FabZ [Yeguia hominis]MBC8534837.1 3-hydroxyacyl-ACP dehydratase FabZ [Yeguia hominis]